MKQWIKIKSKPKKNLLAPIPIQKVRFTTEYSNCQVQLYVKIWKLIMRIRAF